VFNSGLVQWTWLIDRADIRISGGTPRWGRDTPECVRGDVSTVIRPFWRPVWVLSLLSLLVTLCSLGCVGQAPPEEREATGCLQHDGVLAITPDLDGAMIGRCARILEDDANTLSVDDVAGHPESRRGERRIPGYGFSASTYWLRIPTYNPTDSTVAWYLELAYPMLDHVTLFEPLGDGSGYRATQTGDRFPFVERDIDHRNFVFELSSPPRQERDYFLRVRTSSSVNLPMHAWSPTAFAEHHGRTQLILGGYFGILIALVAYVLFLFLSLRDRIHLVYAGSTIAIGMVVASLDGLSFQHLWPFSPWLANVFVPFAVSGVTLIDLVFARTFLEMRRNAPYLRRVYDGLMVLHGANMVLALVGSYRMSMMIAAGMTIPCLALLVANGIISARQGFRPAHFFLLAWSGFLAFAGIYILKTFGVLPNTFVTMWGLHIGSAIEALLLSLALADRIQVMKVTKDVQLAEARAKLESAIAELRRSNVLLEERVATRTTELVKAKNAAETANRTKSTLLANVSHEIRTPMAGILGMVDIVLDTPMTDEQRQSLLSIRTSAQSLLALLNDILDIAKIEAGRLELATHAFSISNVVSESSSVCALRTQGKDVEIVNDVSPEIPDAVIGDANRLRQVLVNLVGNAVKFTDEGEVVLRVEEQGRDGSTVGVLFSVADTGVGIAPSQQEMIFEAFAQGDQGASRRLEGTGLGLAICSQIVPLMGGRMWVESELGRGSTFYFTGQFEIPPRSPLSSNTTVVNVLRGLSVLVVDDSESSREALTRRLSGWGVEVTLTSTAQAAREKVGGMDLGHGFRVALIDAGLPRDQGFELARFLMNAPGPGIEPLMMLTVHGWPVEVAACRALDIEHFLRKPIGPKELLDALVQALSPTTRASIEIPPRAGPSARLSPLKVLLVDDNSINLQVAKHLLTKRGHDVDTASHGIEALEAWRRHDFDIILMDIQMPLMDGFEATRLIRHSEGKKANVPIVAMTASAMKGDRERCLQSGMDGYVAKPFVEDALYYELQRVLRPKGWSSMPPVAPQAPAFDPSLAMANMGGSEELLRRMMRLFIEDATSHLDAIRQAATDRDGSRLRRAAHALKGASANFAAQAVVQSASELEQAGTRGQVDEVNELIEDLDANLIALVDGFRRYLAT
jgi:signal transduction histidine kinase/DNA-binding response OmpR family regulator